MKPWTRSFFLALLGAPAGHAAISVSGVADKVKYDNSVTITITADPGADTTTATLDGAPFTVGTPVLVDSVRYHELKAESRDPGNALVDSTTIRFIVRDSSRGVTEDGIPVFTPCRTVNDAPSAFAGGVFKVIAPSVWPAGLPVPIATRLRDSSDEPLWLNGTVVFGGIPGTTLQMRRGWGSVVAPAMSAGTHQINAQVAGLSDDPAILIEAAPVFTDVAGTISSDETWAANSRHHVTGILTINAGVALTVEEGAIVTVYSGNGTAGSAAEIVVNGTLRIEGVDGNPVVFAPDTATGRWGGIELPAATSNVTADHAIFTGSGEDQNWFNSHGGYTTHKPEQALFLLSGSGSGTNVGARIHLTDCYAFSLGGQEMNSKTNTWVDLSRTLMQRAVTCGELNGSKVTIDRSALIEFPGETAEFADADNDSIYLTNGDLSISNTVIGYTKDDGVDSGGTGGDNPFTAAADVTPFVSTNNWYEGAVHEGNSLSGTHNITQTACVFINCGQGIEDGYSNSTTSDGPTALVDGCLFAGNMVGIRWGDNYGGGYSYNGSMEVRNSFVLNSLFKDAFSGQWRTDQAAGWVYQTTATNSHGQPYFNVHDNHLSQPDPVNHPANTTWDPAVHGALIVPFMPVPGSNVGVAVSSYDPPQQDTAAYPGTFTVRLSTFSSKTVSVDWAVLASDSPQGGNETSLAGGSLVFLPGEMLKTLSPAVASPENHAIIRLALFNPVNAEVTGEAWFFDSPLETSGPLVSYGSTWRYLDNGTDQGTVWRESGFDDSLWQQGPAQLGYGDGDEATTVNAGSPHHATTYFRRTFNVSDVSRISAVDLTLLYDDGGVVYINGQRVAATANMPAGTPGYNFYTGVTSSENATLTVALAPAVLVDGSNTIAVEIHQESAGSSDISFDLKLVPTYTPPFDLKLAASGNDLLLYWFDSGAMLEESTDLGSWSPVPTAASPLWIDSAGPKRFFRLRK